MRRFGVKVLKNIKNNKTNSIASLKWQPNWSATFKIMGPYFLDFLRIDFGSSFFCEFRRNQLFDHEQFDFHVKSTKIKESKSIFVKSGKYRAIIIYYADQWGCRFRLAMYLFFIFLNFLLKISTLNLQRSVQYG